MINTPAEVIKNYVNVGRAKAETPAVKLLALGFLAGIFVAIAAAGANTASAAIENPGAAKLIGALLFPAALSMVIIAGSELFTGDCLMAISLFERKITFKSLLKTWALVYLGNFVGSVFVAYFLATSNQLSLFSNQAAVYSMNVAACKVGLSFKNAFVMGMFCNFLICIAVMMAMAGKGVADKIIGLYFPVMMFVLSGYEHCVANMYYVPVGILARLNPVYVEAAEAAGVNTASLTWGAFFAKNLLPVTLGNIFGGVALVAFLYWFVFLKGAKNE